MKKSLFLGRLTTFSFFLLSILYFSVPGNAQLSGTYTIDPGSSASKTNYQNFASAVGDMLSGTRTDGGTAYGPKINGAVTFKVANGTYNEQIEITAIGGASAKNTVTFQSAKGDSSKVILTQLSSTLSGTNYTLYLNGASYVTFSKMTISRTSSYYYSTVVEMDGGSNWNTFQNCQILGAPTTSNTSVESLVYSGGSNDSNNTFINNYMVDGSYAFYWVGTASNTEEPGNIIKGNIIDSTYYSGIYAEYQKGLITSGNTVINLGNTSSSLAMYFYYCDTALSVVKNKIYLSNGANMGIYVYYCVGTSTSRLLVADNMISIGGSSTSYGIYSWYSGYMDFFYNSVLITNSSTNSTGIYNEGFYSYQINNIENNISDNTGGGTAINIYYYDIYTMDYNDWYTTSASLFAEWNFSAYSNLLSLQTASGKDANSMSVNPYFVSSGNLHASGPKIYKAGTPLTTVTDDIDGQTRSTSTPCIGADEFTLPANDGGIYSISSPSGNYCAGTNNVMVNITNFGGATLTSAKINWKVNDTLQTAYSWTGSLTPGNSSVVNVGTYTFKSSNIYKVKAWTTSPNGSTDGNNSNDTSLVTGLRQGLSGTYTIGSGGSYSTFSAAAADLTLHGVCGPVVFNVLNVTYKDQITLTSIPGTSVTSTVTFQSKSGDSSKVILADSATSSSNNFAVNLNGAQFVNFRKMTFTTLNTNNYGILVLLQNGANYDSFSSCQMISATTSNNSQNYAIVYAQGSVNNNDVFWNNLLQNGSFGFYYSGVSSNSLSYLDNGTVIQNNILQNQYGYGIYFQTRMRPL